MKKIRTIAVLCALAFQLSSSGCSEGEDDSGNVNSSVKLKITSSNLSADASVRSKAKLRQSARVTNASQGTVVTVGTTCVTMGTTEWCDCSITNQTENNNLYTAKNGYCATPLSIEGGISAIALSAIGDPTGGSPRILGGGMELSGNQEGKVDVSILDLSAANELTGEDNIEGEQVPTRGYNGVNILLSHLDVKMPPLTVSSSTTYYYTLRYVFYTQPLSEEPVVAACGIDEHYMESLATNSKLLGTASISRNDILMCVKTAAADICADTDFKWLDTTTNGAETFAATRPATSVTYQQDLVPDDYLSCTVSSEGIPDMAAGGLGLLGMLTSNVDVSAVSEKGQKTYTVGSETGTNLEVTLDIDTENLAFVETNGAGLQAYFDTKLNADSTGATFAESIHFMPIYIRHQLATRFNCGNNCSYTERDTAFYATMTVSVSN